MARGENGSYIASVGYFLSPLFIAVLIWQCSDRNDKPMDEAKEEKSAFTYIIVDNYLYGGRNHYLKECFDDLAILISMYEIRIDSYILDNAAEKGWRKVINNYSTIENSVCYQKLMTIGKDRIKKVEILEDIIIFTNENDTLLLKELKEEYDNAMLEVYDFYNDIRYCNDWLATEDDDFINLCAENPAKKRVVMQRVPRSAFDTEGKTIKQPSNMSSQEVIKEEKEDSSVPRLFR